MTLIFRQMFDAASSTYTYLLGDAGSHEAVLIDPVFEQAGRDAACLTELGLKLLATLETHTHADHVTGAWLLRERLKCKICVPEKGGAQGADRLLRHGERIAFGKRFLEACATPGHTAGCMTYVLDDQSMAFTGDALLIRGCGRTDFQEGDAHRLYRSVHEQIFSLPDSCLIYPGHDYRGLGESSVGEEKRFNPRLGGKIGENDFVLFMENLRLPHPKQMAHAVPANLQCGRPDHTVPQSANWAPLTLTFAGIWEIEPHWLEEHLSEVRVLDVREPGEFAGQLGRVPGSLNVPIAALPDAAAGLSKETPIVAVCRSGARSAQATVLLAKAGYLRVANLPGGMLRWSEERRTVERG